MSKVTVTIRLNRALNDTAKQELNELGLSLNDYIKMAVQQLVIQKGVPFRIKADEHNDEIANPTTRRAIIKAMAEEEGLIADEGKHCDNDKDAMNALLHHEKQ